MLCTRPTQLVVFFIVLTHWNNSAWVDMSLHSDTLSWCWGYQSLLCPSLILQCLAENQEISTFIVFCLIQCELEPTIYITRGEHSNTTDVAINEHERQHHLILTCLTMSFHYQNVYTNMYYFQTKVSVLKIEMKMFHTVVVFGTSRKLNKKTFVQPYLSFPLYL